KNCTRPLVTAAAEIPALSMRADAFSLIPLLRHWSSLRELINLGDIATGSFEPFMDGPECSIADPWLRQWLDALAFSLSGLPARRTPAAAMAYTLFDMHRSG
ncbi:MAG: carotene isomerase, partial [Bacteroidota bacterium]